eukprot:RCo014934
MEVKEFPLVGRAAVAARPFSRGEIVLIEHPLMILPKPRQETPLFDGLDDIGERNHLQKGLLYPIVYYHKASDEIKSKVHEFYSPKLEPGTVQHTRYYGAAEEVVKLPGLTDLTPEAVVRFLMIMRINSHMLGDGTKMSALFYMGSKVTHSCQPNCMAMGLGTKLSYRALHDIPKGELITFSYISGFDLWKSTPVRRALLRETRFFTCVCQRCVGPDTTRMMKCPKCGDPNTVYFMTGQAGFLGTDPRPPTDTPWTCQNPQCGAKFKDEEMPMDLEKHMQEKVLTTYFGNATETRVITVEYTEAMEIACDRYLGPMHWLSAMVVYARLAQHHNMLNHNEKPSSTGQDCVAWADRLARWMQATMPNSMPEAVIAKFAGQSCEVYGVNQLAADYYKRALPLLRVHYGDQHKDVQEMETFVQKVEDGRLPPFFGAGEGAPDGNVQQQSSTDSASKAPNNHPQQQPQKVQPNTSKPKPKKGAAYRATAPAATAASVEGRQRKPNPKQRSSPPAALEE